MKDTVFIHMPEGFALSDAEARHIRGTAADCGATRAEVRLAPDGEHLEIEYLREAPRFERIRRITGYLVGTLERFNDAKKAEERDRVKHPAAGMPLQRCCKGLQRPVPPRGR